MQSQPQRAVYKSTSELGTPLYMGQPAGSRWYPLLGEIPLYYYSKWFNLSVLFQAPLECCYLGYEVVCDCLDSCLQYIHGDKCPQVATKNVILLPAYCCGRVYSRFRVSCLIAHCITCVMKSIEMVDEF